MNSNQQRRLWLSVLAGVVLTAGWPSAGQTSDEEIRIVEIQGTVEISPAGATTWVLTQTNQALHPHDRLRTAESSRAAIRWSDHTVLPVGAATEIEIQAPPDAEAAPGLNLVRGVVSFFHRDKPGRIRIITQGSMAGIEGTEFVMSVDDHDGTARTTVSVIDGKVTFSDAAGQGTLVLTNGDQAVAESGALPKRTAGFIANNVLQWCFYYPAVLDLNDLELPPEAKRMLADSLAAYQTGDLLQALAKYPAGRPAASDAERIYHDALLLAVGQIAEAESDLNALSSREPDSRVARLAGALQWLISAVCNEHPTVRSSAELPTERLAASYYAQSRAAGDASLAEALDLAREAAMKSPNFSFAWERVAELQFSFGRTDAALEAMEKSLQLSPRNAQALALKGFLLSARNRTHEAIGWFDQSLAVDAALGNAWLGRGLCRIREGDERGGREDLLLAAALEPQRAALRSYLGKAYADAGDDLRANREFKQAVRLDPNDPTAWLYSALLKQRENRINEAVRDLEHSQDLNNNRAVYRSRLLLDQDAAVRGANLAGIYRDAGMDDVSVREATRAVNFDYVNYSAHLFLANSYNQLRDPNQINLRYETPWLSEFLVANLLAPVGAGTLSQTVSAQEYSKLFEHDRLGIASSTEYLSRGAWLQGGAQYGTFGNFGYALDSFYLSDNGQRSNNDQEQLTLSLQLKQQFTPQDSVFLQAIYYNASAGDLKQYYDPADANTGLRTKENQEPLLLLGYHHEWSPGVHTLVLAGRFTDDSQVTDTNTPVLLLARNGAGNVIAVPTPALPTASLSYQDQAEIYSAEAQQIFETGNHGLVLGARYQVGTFDTASALGASTPTLLASTTATTGIAFASSPISQSAALDFERASGYGYYYWRVVEPLQLVGGVSYDYLQYPENFRTPPLSASQTSEDQVSPKAGFTWTPARDTVVRFGYTRSLGGVSFDQSVRLEPSQVAGFNQAFRSMIPESIAGSISGAKFETFGLALEQKFKTGTYLGVEAGWLNSDAQQTIGAVDLNFPPTYVASGTRENLDYTEKNLAVTVNQLLGDCWSLGVRYQLSDAELETTYPDIPSSVTSANYSRNGAMLNEVSLFALFNHPSGFFARAEGNWYDQRNRGYQPGVPGDDFWQVNLLAGYRFYHRHAQVQLGVLNLLDQDYRLNPLNLHPDLPRTRTFYTGVQFNF